MYDSIGMITSPAMSHNPDVMYFYFHLKNHYGAKHITSGLWLIAGLIIIPIESYIGPSNYGGNVDQ